MQPDTLEEILLRVESKLDAHIEATEQRISRLERGWAYAKGIFVSITTGVLVYFKVSRP
jgi:hypothetical protein